jgi:hypothetical protein
MDSNFRFLVARSSNGINLGDVIAEEHDIFGDEVNVATRLEALAEPGGICLSGTVRDHIGDRLPYTFKDLGEQKVKNIARPVRVYALRRGASAKPPAATEALTPSGSQFARSPPAVDCGVALWKSQQRPGAGLLRRRDYRRSHNRPVADRGHVRDLPEYGVHLQE